jgi:uncharacterized protein
VIVVIDSGVWISGLAFGGTPDLAIQRGVGIDQVAVCDQIKNEVGITLAGKMGWDQNRVAQAFATYFKNAIWVSITGRIRGVCRDPKDDAIIECAANAKAELIISGDKDLLTLKHYDRIRIITPQHYVASPDNGDLRSR